MLRPPYPSYTIFTALLQHYNQGLILLKITTQVFLCDMKMSPCISQASEDRESTDSTKSSSSARDKVRSNLANGSNLLLAQWQTDSPVTSHTTAAPGSDKSTLTLYGVKRKGQRVCLCFSLYLFFFFTLPHKPHYIFSNLIYILKRALTGKIIWKPKHHTQYLLLLQTIATRANQFSTLIYFLLVKIIHSF